MDEPLDRIRVHIGRSTPPASVPSTVSVASEAKPSFSPDPVGNADAEPPAEDHEEISQSSDDGQPNKFKRLLRGYWHHKLWTLPLTALVIVAAVLAVPASRYSVLAFFISRPYSITVTDSTTGTPISGATVKLDGKAVLTDSKGEATITSAVGSQVLSVSKTYYKSATQTVLVDVMTANDVLHVRLVATGRQVPVQVINKITGKPIPEAVITVGNTDAKTSLDGTATIVLPASAATQNATITVDGYNDLSTTVQVTTQTVAANTFAMVPKGQIFFLSDLSGKVDVVSTNLDGSDRQTVLAGTGSEDKNNTVLLASRDWQYLALLSKRAGGQDAILYLINTSNGKLTTIDSTTANFTLLGWSGHYFAYLSTRTDLQSWQPGDQAIISYNADSNKSTTLATSKATGSSQSDAQYQTFGNPFFLSTDIITQTTWWNGNGTPGVAGQQNTLTSLKVDGTGSKTLKSVDAGTSYIDTSVLANPEQAYFSVSAVGGGSSNYYRLDTNGNVTQSSTITADAVSQSYPTYLISPSGSSTFWTSVRDGKNTLFVGDSNGNNGTQIASLSDYSPYGWYTDDYLLVQKDASELYILPAIGGTPQKISDYFKPDYAIYGYGGGYGGF